MKGNPIVKLYDGKEGRGEMDFKIKIGLGL